MRSSTLGKFLGGFVLAIAIGGLIGWWASRNPSTPPITEPVAEPVQTSPQAPSNPLSIAQPPNLANASSPVPGVAELPETERTWDEQLDDILGSDDDEGIKAQQMLEMMPKVDTEAQVELAGHIVNLIDDAQLLAAAHYLTNAAVPEEVSSVFMDDLYNRANAVKLPLILDIAKNEQHPLHSDARDLLELYVEEDYGTNWVQWEAAMKAWIAENPDE